MGVGFKLPKQLKKEIAKSDKIVVRRVVRPSDPETEKSLEHR
jgi:hypothetical protein